MNKLFNKNIQEICIKEQIDYLALFGSTARGDQNLGSDVDLLINFKKEVSFFDLAKVQEKFEKLFSKKVDLVLENKLKASLKKYITQDLQTLYEER